MKKILISLILIFALCPMGSFAEEMPFQQIPVENSFVPLGGASISAGEEIPSEPTDFPAFFGNFTFEEYICAFVMESETLPSVIEGVEQFGINKDEFADLYFDIALKHPELFLKTAYSSLRYNAETGMVQSFTPRYLVSSVEEAEEGREILAAGVEEYIEATEGYATSLEKLLIIHDKMVADCDYDVNALDKNTEDLVPDSTRHAIGVFRDNFAVCQGYSQALYMIAKELDIEMDFCISDEKNHMWNYVNLDGKWYHMDMTNDDPVEKNENGELVARMDARASHRFFMVSDTGLKISAHGSDARTFSGKVYSCNDRKYETDHIFNIDTVFTAKKEDDGFYHVPVAINFSAEETKETVNFRSATLYTGAALNEFCTVESTKGKNLYFVIYSTKELKNAFAYFSYNNTNQLQKTSVFNMGADTIGLVFVASDVPENKAIEFSSFLWEADTLVPFSVNTKWEQE